MKKTAALIFSLLVLPSIATALEWGLGTAVSKSDAKTHDLYIAENPTVRLPACSQATLMSTAPVALSSLTAILPLGNLGPYGHTLPTDHIYFNMVTVDTNNPTALVDLPIQAPGAITITEIYSSHYFAATPPFTDYAVRFSPCSGVTFYFSHIKALSPELLAAFQQGSDCTTYNPANGNIELCRRYVFIPLNTGELIGTVKSAGGLGQISSWDVGVFDVNRPALPFVNPAQHGFQRTYTQCPLDYFTADVQAALTPKLGRYDGSQFRTIPPLCGEIAQDVAGTAQGHWFVPGHTSSDSETQDLALVHDNVLPSTGVFSVGLAMAPSGLTAATYSFFPTHAGFVNRDFDEVTADGNVYCYDGFTNLINAVILVKLPTSTTLRMERQALASCGAGPWSLTAAATLYER